MPGAHCAFPPSLRVAHPRPVAYDRAEASPYPAKWNLPVCYTISAVLASVIFAASILYLHLMMDSHNPDGAWRSWGLGAPPLLAGGA